MVKGCRLISFLISTGVSLLLCAGVTSCAESQETTSFTAMNTFMTVKSYGAGSKTKAANQQVQKEIERLEGILSTTLEGSDVWEINNGSGVTAGGENSGRRTGDVTGDLQKAEISQFTVHPETAYLIEQSQKFYTLTGGAFNPALYPVIREWGFTTGDYKVPEAGRILELLGHTDFSEVKLEGNSVYRPAGLQLDFGAIGKGYAGDVAVSILKENGVKSALLDFGGNIQVLGSKPDGSDWTVGIKNPWGDGNGGSGSPVAAVKLHDACMITSGGYERFFTDENGKKYIHIFDGTTGCPVENNLESVTIICERGLYGDVLSTSLFVMGEKKAIDFWQSARDFDFVILTKDKRIIYSAPLKNSISLLFDFDSVLIVEALEESALRGAL